MPHTIGPADPSIYQVGAWEVVPALGLLRRQEVEIRLTLQQMRLLALLIANGSQVTRRETILEVVWAGVAVEENALSRCVSEVRRALGDDARRPGYIETLPKRGYRLIAPVRVLATVAPNASPPIPSGAVMRNSADSSIPTPEVSARASGSRRLAAVAFGGIVLVLLVWWGASATHRSKRLDTPTTATSGPAGTRPTVAVLALASHRPDPATLNLSVALAEMLTSEVAASEALAVVPRAVISALRHELSLSLDADQMDQTIDRILQALDLDYLIGGSFLVTGGDDAQMRLDLRIRSHKVAEAPRALAESGALDRLPDVVASVGQRLREMLGAETLSDTRRRQPAAHHVVEVLAIRKYVAALGALRRLDNQNAVLWLEESLRLRPDQPLPYLALSEAWSQLGYRRRAEEAGRHAQEAMPGLGAEYRLWIEAHLAALRHAWPEAVDSYRLLWAGRPENLEIGLRLARAQIAAGDGANAIETLGLLRSKVSDPRVDPRIDLAEAVALDQQGQFELALQAAERALAQAFAAGAGLVVGEVRLCTAAILYNLGEVEPAKETLEQARRVFEHAEDARRLAQARSTLAAWQMLEGDFVGARALTSETLATFRRIGDAGGEAKQLMVLADLEQELGSSEIATTMIEEAITIFQEIDDKSGEAGAFRIRGIIAARRQRYGEAEAHFSESLLLYRALGDRTREGGQLINLARVHMFRGQWSEAATFFESAKQFLVESGNEHSLAQLAVNLGLAHAATGHLLLAEPQLRQAVELYRQLGNNRELANAMSYLGEVLTDRGDLTAARSSLEQALMLRQEMGEPSRIVTSRNALTVVLLELGLWQAAAAHVAVTMKLDGIEDNDIIVALRLLARSLLGQGRLQEARQVIRQAVGRLAASSLPQTVFSRAYVPITQARIEAASGDFAKARERLEELLERTDVQALLLINAEARLALAQVEIAAGAIDRPTHRLTALIQETEAEGWSLLATKANRALAELSTRKVR